MVMLMEGERSCYRSGHLMEGEWSVYGGGGRNGFVMLMEGDWSWRWKV